MAEFSWNQEKLDAYEMDFRKNYGAKIAQPELMYVDEQELEEDREYLMQIYPAKAKMIMVMIEDACDRLEYEGSPMFAMYPDRESIFQIARQINDKVCCNNDDNLKSLIEVMLCNEFYVRRSRYKRRRRFF